MSISEKDIREHEEKHKKFFCDANAETISKISQIITKIQETGQDIIIDTKIPNIGITFNNKLNELAHEFRRAGISLYTETSEKYDYVSTNFVGIAIIEDLIYYLSKGSELLSEYESSIEITIRKKTEEIKEVEELGGVKKIFWLVRSFFNPSIISDLIYYSDEELREIDSYFIEYKEIDDSLWEYNLNDNLVQSLVKFINSHQYNEFNIPELMQESVIPILQKLGLEELIPQLQAIIDKPQEQSISSDKKSWELTSTEKIEIQTSSTQLANEFEQNQRITTKDQEREYGE